MTDTIHSAPRFQVFGDLRLTIAGVEIDLGPPRQRLLLAELLAARGRAVGTDHLIDSLWGDSPPDSAMNQIHRYVGDLRRGLESDLKVRAVGSYIAPTPSGYRLMAGTVSSDLADFYVQANEAAKLSANAAVLATSAYERLLAMVAHSAFADLPFDAGTRPQFAEIERDRLNVAVAAADHALSHGEARRLSGPIEHIAASALADERLQARTIRLIASQGRTADALDLFDRTRRLLAEEFGIGPGAELFAAYRFVLAEDEHPDNGPDASTDVIDTLRPRSVSFLARPDQELVLDEARDTATGGGSSIVVLSGMAGIGKTTIANNWAHDAKSDFPNGALYVDLRGFTPEGVPVEPATVIDALLTDLGVELQGLDPRPAYRRSLYKQRIGSGRYLLLLDNARDADQVRPLLPDGSGSMVVITSRDTLTSLVIHVGAIHVPVDRLSEAEASELLLQRLGRRGADEPRAVEAMITACAGLPLALTIVAARANLQRTSRLPDLVRELTSSREKLSRLRVDSAHSDVRSAFTWSHRLLSPGAARLFARLSVHPGPRISLAAAASCGHATLEEARGAIDELLAANMLTRSVGDQFEVHDLMRLFAQELLDGPELRIAEVALVNYFVASMRAAFVGLRRTEPSHPIPWIAKALSEPFASPAAIVEWYQREQTALSIALQICRDRGLDAEFASIVLDSRSAQSAIRGASSPSLGPAEETLAAAVRSTSLSLEADALLEIAFRRSMDGDRAGASTAYDAALELFRRDGNDVGTAHLRRGQVIAALQSGDLDQAGALLTPMIAAARASSQEPLLIDALSVAASVAVEREDWQGAISATDEVRDIAAGPDGYGHLAVAANRAIALNMVERYREAYDLLSACMTPPEEDSFVTFGLLAEFIVSASHVGDLAGLDYLHDRYRGYMERFGTALAEDYPEQTLTAVQRRIDRAMQRSEILSR